MYIYQVIVNYDVEAVKENFKTIAMMLKAESKISEPAAHLENITDLHENFIPGSEIHRPRRAHLCTSSEILSGNCFCRSCRDCRRAEATVADSGNSSPNLEIHLSTTSHILRRRSDSSNHGYGKVEEDAAVGANW